MLLILAFILATNVDISAVWPVVVAAVSPFVATLGIVLKWLMTKIDKAEDAKDRAVDKANERLLEATPVLKESARVNGEVLVFLRQLEGELRAERELRIRVEERLDRAERQAGGKP